MAVRIPRRSDNQRPILSFPTHLEVVPPEGSDLVLAADVPDGEGNVFVLDGFNVEADGRNGGDDLAEFKLVEDRGFPGRVQPDHQDAHLLLPEQTLKEAAKVKTHFLSFFRFFSFYSCYL